MNQNPKDNLLPLKLKFQQTSKQLNNLIVRKNKKMNISICCAITFPIFLLLSFISFMIYFLIK